MEHNATHTLKSATAAVAAARADWYAACDTLEFAQDTGKSKRDMRRLELACSAAYDAVQDAVKAEDNAYAAVSR